MAKEIIILELNPNVPAGVVSVHYLLWLNSPSPLPNVNFVSQFANASAAEKTALQNGTVVEESYMQAFPSSLTTTQIKVFLNAHYTSRQAYWTSIPGPGTAFGVFFDSVSGWSA